MKSFKFLRKNPDYDSTYKVQRELCQKIFDASKLIHLLNIKGFGGYNIFVSTQKTHSDERL